MPCREILKLGLEQGVLFNVCAENVIRLLPPYILTEDETTQLADKICQCVRAFQQQI